VTCDEAYEAILEAGPVDLAEPKPGPLAEHLSACTRCRRLAEVVLAEEAILGNALTDLVPTPPLEEILAQGKVPYRRRKAAWFAALPLAAAATMAGLFLAGRPQISGPIYTPPPSLGGLNAEAPEGQNLVVLQTNNPDITVLWLF
jgi:hypothetical protein